MNDVSIYDRIMASVLDHRLPPGTRLTEDKLAQIFGVSRTLIKPVLVRLANEHIVTLAPNKGATIATPTQQESREVFEARRLIEPVLLSHFMQQATAADINVLSQLLDDETQAQHAKDMRTAIRLSGEFHLHIAKRSGHETFGGILREMVSRSSLILMTWGKPAATLADPQSCGCDAHHALVDAIRLGDVATAQALMHQHLLDIEAQLDFLQHQEKTFPIEEVLSA
jgi:DNA-binding GntR family transcriptional regulator